MGLTGWVGLDVVGLNFVVAATVSCASRRRAFQVGGGLYGKKYMRGGYNLVVIYLLNREGGGGMSTDVADTLFRYLLKGMSLYQEDDHQWLTTDPTIYTPSSDGHLLGFLPYRMGIAPAFRRDAIIVSPVPSYLRHLPRPRRCTSTSSNWCSKAPLECHRRQGHPFPCSSK